MSTKQNKHNQEALVRLLDQVAEAIALLGSDPESPPTFGSWKESWFAAVESEDEIMATWLWDALRTAPTVRAIWRDLPPAGVPWDHKDQHFRVLPSGAEFVVGLRQSSVQRLMQPPHSSQSDSEITVCIRSELSMRPGKGVRLECCDVAADVTIRTQQVWTKERASDVMRIEEEWVTISDEYVIARVVSLNQAYTIAARLLQPERRSHSGRIYDHFVFVPPAGPRVRLETVRRCVESGTWKVPEMKEPQTGSGQG